MKIPDEIWLVESKGIGTKYHPFCGSIGCKSKTHAKDLAIDKAKELGLPCRISLYKRIQRKNK